MLHSKINKIIGKSWKKQSIIVITLCCLLINAFILTLYIKNEKTNGSKEWVIHSYEVLWQSKIVLGNLKDMEIGQRGYLLSNKKEFLEPYEQSRKYIIAETAKLAKLVEDKPEQQKNIFYINSLIVKHDELLKAQINKFDSKRSYISIADLQQSNDSINTIRNEVEAFITRETGYLRQRENDLEHRREDYTRTLIIGSILALLGIILANGIIIYQSNKQRNTEDELKKNQEIYNLIIENINEGLYEYDLLNHTAFYSKGYKQMLGYTDAEFENASSKFNETVHPDDYAASWEVINKYLKHETQEYRNIFRLRHKDGHYIWVMSRGVGIEGDKKGKIQKLVGTITDISEQKENEEYLKHLNSELETFTYVTSHDLRAPLVNLKGFSGELQHNVNELKKLINDTMPKTTKVQVNVKLINNILDSDIPESLRYIGNSVERLDQLTTAILDLSRIGRRELKSEFINVEDMVNKILGSLAFDISSKKATVTFGVLPNATTDRFSLQQVFANIIENAVKYLDDSRLGIIHIEGAASIADVQYTISDNGRGIDENDKSRVFDMFKRARNTEEIRGAGMGMAFVKATIQRLGGKIWFESTIGQGSKFIFTIPNIMKKEVTNVTSA